PLPTIIVVKKHATETTSRPSEENARILSMRRTTGAPSSLLLIGPTIPSSPVRGTLEDGGSLDPSFFIRSSFSEVCNAHRQGQVLRRGEGLRLHRLRGRTGCL